MIIELNLRPRSGEPSELTITVFCLLHTDWIWFSNFACYRVPRNCLRSFNITVFDPDGDHIRCSIATSSNNYECGLCGPTGGFSLDRVRIPVGNSICPPVCPMLLFNSQTVAAVICCVMEISLIFCQNSCSLKHTDSGLTGYHLVELLVQDFPRKQITLLYSDESYTSKQPPSLGRPPVQ